MKKTNSPPRIVRLLRTQQFFEGFVPIMALYSIMFERTAGLSFEQIGLLFAIWSLAFLIFELPSGVLADYWSRKKLIVLGGLIRAVGFSVWLLSPSFSGYAFGFICWGIQIAFSSGSIPALLENELELVGQKSSFTKYFGLTTSAFWLGVFAGHTVSALLTLGNVEQLIIFSAAASAISGFVMLFCKESPYAKRDSYIATLKAGLNEVRGSRRLQFLGFVLFSTYMIIGVLEELLPRLYSEFGLGDSQVSLALSAVLVLTIFVVARLESTIRFSINKQIGVMILGLSLLLLALYLGSLAGVALVMLFSLIFQLFRPLFQNHIIKATEGAEKATVSSIPGLAGGLLGAIAYFLIGKISRSLGETGAIAVYSGFWLIILGAAIIVGMRVLDKKDTD